MQSENISTLYVECDQMYQSKFCVQEFSYFMSGLNIQLEHSENKGLIRHFSKAHASEWDRLCDWCSKHWKIAEQLVQPKFPHRKSRWRLSQITGQLKLGLGGLRRKYLLFEESGSLRDTAMGFVDPFPYGSICQYKTSNSGFLISEVMSFCRAEGRRSFITIWTNPRSHIFQSILSPEQSSSAMHRNFKGVKWMDNHVEQNDGRQSKDQEAELQERFEKD